MYIQPTITPVKEKPFHVKTSLADRATSSTGTVQVKSTLVLVLYNNSYSYQRTRFDTGKTCESNHFSSILHARNRRERKASFFFFSLRTPLFLLENVSRFLSFSSVFYLSWRKALDGASSHWSPSRNKIIVGCCMCACMYGCTHEKVHPRLENTKLSRYL